MLKYSRTLTLFGGAAALQAKEKQDPTGKYGATMSPDATTYGTDATGATYPADAAGAYAPDAPAVDPSGMPYPDTSSDAYPDASGAYPDTSGAYPDASGAYAPDAPAVDPSGMPYPDTNSDAYPDASGGYPDASGMPYPDASGAYAPDAPAVDPSGMPYPDATGDYAPDAPAVDPSGMPYTDATGDYAPDATAMPPTDAAGMPPTDAAGMPAADADGMDGYYGTDTMSYGMYGSYGEFDPHYMDEFAAYGMDELHHVYHEIESHAVPAEDWGCPEDTESCWIEHHQLFECVPHGECGQIVAAETLMLEKANDYYHEMDNLPHYECGDDSDFVAVMLEPANFSETGADFNSSYRCVHYEVSWMYEEAYWARKIMSDYHSMPPPMNETKPLDPVPVEPVPMPTVPAAPAATSIPVYEPIESAPVSPLDVNAYGDALDGSMTTAPYATNLKKSRRMTKLKQTNLQ